VRDERTAAPPVSLPNRRELVAASSARIGARKPAALAIAPGLGLLAARVFGAWDIL
jgi:hypothetical protein